MVTYIIVFIISCILAKIASVFYINREKKNKIFFLLISFFVILIPALLAGLRGRNVGTDVNSYIMPGISHSIKATSLKAFLKTDDLELIFGSFIYFVANNFENAKFIILFFIEFIILLLVYSELIRKADKFPTWLGLFIFYFVFYNATLNAMRQYIAIAIVFFSSRYIEKKKIIKFLICIILALGFHKSSILCISFYPLYHLFKDNKRKKLKIILVFLLILLLCFYNKLLQFFTNQINLLPEKYYERYSLNINDFDFQEVETSYRVIFLTCICFCYKKICKSFSGNSAYIYLLFLDFIFIQLGCFSRQAYRISLYFGIHILQIYPQLLGANKIKNDFNSKFYFLLIISVSVAYWLYISIISNANETYPYVLDL